MPPGNGTRQQLTLDAIQGIFKAMNQIECDAVPSDFDDEWRALRLRFAHAQSKFEHILNGAADITQPAKPMVYYAGPA
jgi:hypothetical protein